MTAIKPERRPSPYEFPDAAELCRVCTGPLAGCSSGVFCVRCATQHVRKKRWGYADLRPSTYYVPVR